MSAAPAAYGVEPNADGEIGTAAKTLQRRMRDIENEGRVFDASAPYVKSRRLLVDWICECAEAHRLASSTAHAAVGLLDRALQLVKTAKDKFQLVALTCLTIAAKYEEKEEDVPSLRALQDYVERLQGAAAARLCDARTVHNMEVLVLMALHWSVTVVTPLHYLGILERQGVIFETDTMGHKPLVPKIVRYMSKYLHFFADLCLQEYSFQAWSPSLLAAAVVLAARKALNIRPLWASPALENALGYSYAAAAPAFHAVWEHYVANFPKEAGDALAQEAKSDQEARDAAAAAAAMLGAATARSLNSSAAFSAAASCNSSGIDAAALGSARGAAAASGGDENDATMLDAHAGAAEHGAAFSPAFGAGGAAALGASGFSASTLSAPSARTDYSAGSAADRSPPFSGSCAPFSADLSDVRLRLSTARVAPDSSSSSSSDSDAARARKAAAAGVGARKALRFSMGGEPGVPSDEGAACKRAATESAVRGGDDAIKSCGAPRGGLLSPAVAAAQPLRR